MSQHEWVHGIHSVTSILKSQPQRLLRIHVQQGRQDERVQKIIDAAQRNNIEIIHTPRKQLDKLCAGNHQGIRRHTRNNDLHKRVERFGWQLCASGNPAWTSHCRHAIGNEIPGGDTL